MTHKSVEGALKPLNLAVVTDTYTPDLNGVAVCVAEQIRALQALGHKVTLLRAAPAGAEPKLDFEHRFASVPLPGYPGLRLGLPSQKLIRALMRLKPDVIYIANESLLGLSALSWARQSGTPVVTALHTRFDQLRLSSWQVLLSRPLKHWIVFFHKRSDLVVCPSTQVHTELMQLGVKHCMHLPHGVDLSRFNKTKRSAALRTHLGVKPGEFLFGFVGRLSEEKNLAALASALAALNSAQQPKTHLVVAGTGPMQAELEQNLKATGAPFSLLGGVTGESLATLYASLDAFVMPGKRETFGLVTLEALASGVPVAAFNLAAAAHVVKNAQTGELAATLDGEALNQACLRLQHRLSHNHVYSPESACAGFSWQANALELSRCMHTLVRRKKRSRLIQLGQALLYAPKRAAGFAYRRISF